MGVCEYTRALFIGCFVIYRRLAFERMKKSEFLYFLCSTNNIQHLTHFSPRCIAYEMLSFTTSASRIFSTPLFPPSLSTSSLACVMSRRSTSRV